MILATLAVSFSAATLQLPAQFRVIVVTGAGGTGEYADRFTNGPNSGTRRHTRPGDQ